MQITIPLEFGKWVNLYDYGVPPLTKILIQNQGEHILKLSDKQEMPSLPEDSVTEVVHYEFYSNDATDLGAWAFGDGDLMVRW